MNMIDLKQLKKGLRITNNRLLRIITNRRVATRIVIKTMKNMARKRIRLVAPDGDVVVDTMDLVKEAGVEEVAEEQIEVDIMIKSQRALKRLVVSDL